MTSRHIAAYRRFLLLFPPGHRSRHGADQIQLFTDLLAAGHSPRRLWLAAAGDLARVVLASTPKRAMAHLAKLALYPLSTLNTLAGLGVIVLALFTAAIPPWVAGPAAAVAAQGIYTLVWLRQHLPLPPHVGDLLFATGEVAALVVGTTGLVAAAITQSTTADPEYGPPTILALVAVHGIVGLIARLPDTPAPTTIGSA